MSVLLENKELFAGLSVLYVEDDDILAQSTIKLLGNIFKTIDRCSDGQEGLIKYTTKLYDIVITDINMPIMNGLIMAQEIRYINPNQAIIVISAHDDNKYFLEAIKLGIDGFIIKPFVIQDVISILVKLAKNIGNIKELESYKNIDISANNDFLEEYSDAKTCMAFKKLLKTKEKLTLVLLNIDNFSNINDAYGNEIGDEVLREIAKKLQMLSFSDIDLYKLESDEYALVNTSSLDIGDAQEIAELIISFFNESPIAVDDDFDIELSVSIGISTGSSIKVLNEARSAIKDLRMHTKGTYKVYDSNSKYMTTRQENVYWVNTIRESIVNENIVAFFQPIVNNHTKKIEKYECLARVYDDDNYVSPYHFMDAAKETRVLPVMTRSMIKQSCKMFAKTNYEFSINITNDDFHMEYLENYLLRQTKMYDIEPCRIVLELLEDIATLQKGSILKQLISLREKGFKLAIDDFGSESSNFSRFLEFHPDYVKIDGAFVKNILHDEKSQVITAGITSIAHQLGIKVIAEFIHNKEVQEKIESLGIDYSQGYFHGAPSREIEPEL